MKASFILGCGSTVDMPFSYMESRDIPILFYTYSIDGAEYVDDMGRDKDALPRFYGFIQEGRLPVTSQINQFRYEEFFHEQLKKGDLLYIAFGSGMSASVNNAFAAAEAIRSKYPDRKLVVIDSTCSSSGYGLLVDWAADMRDAGASIEETAKWVMAHRKNVHHQFFSTDLTMFRRSGRVSGPTAMIATVLGICPIMRLNDEGRIIAYDKVRGKKAALKRTLDVMEAHAVNGRGYDGKCFISHSNCIETAEALKEELELRFPNQAGNVRIFDIGTIIASHCGPGTVALFFLGDERTALTSGK